MPKAGGPSNVPSEARKRTAPDRRGGRELGQSYEILYPYMCVVHAVGLQFVNFVTLYVAKLAVISWCDVITCTSCKCNSAEK